jgi:hypothetical protein
VRSSLVLSGDDRPMDLAVCEPTSEVSNDAFASDFLADELGRATRMRGIHLHRNSEA